MKRLLWFILGILMGIILTVGSIVGTGWWLYSKFTVGKLEETMKKEIIKGDDPEKIKEMALQQLIPFAIGFMQDYQNITLNRVKNTFGVNVPDKLGNFDLTPFMDTTLPQLPEKLGEVLGNMTIEEMTTMFNITLPDQYIINKLKTKKLNELHTLGDEIANFEVFYLVNPSPGSLLYKLSVIDKGNGEVEYVKISEIQTRMQTLTLRDFLGDAVADSSAFMQAIADSQISNVGESINQLTLGQVVSSDSTLPNALKEIKITNLGAELPTAIGRLTMLDFQTMGVVTSVPTSLHGKTLDDILAIVAAMP